MSHEPRRLITVAGAIGGPNTLQRVLAVGAPASEACCFDVGQSSQGQAICIDLSPFQCQSFGGTHRGPGTTCATETCEVPIPGACCIDGGGCVDSDSDTCLPPDFFVPGASCSDPGICEPDCWFEGTDCCAGPGLEQLGAINCNAANFIAQSMGPVFTFRCIDTCFNVDVNNSPVLNVLTGHADCMPVGPDLFGECVDCCDILNLCPPPSPNYCAGCPSLELNIAQLTWTVNACDPANGIIVGSTMTLQCQDPPRWLGSTFAGPILCPGLPQSCNPFATIECDGDGTPSTWHLRLTVDGNGQDDCTVPWVIDLAFRSPRGAESYPSGPGIDYDAITVVDNSQFVDSWTWAGADSSCI